MFVMAAEEAEALSGSTVAWFLVVAVVLLILNAFYVAYEFAILAAKRSAFESPRYAGNPSGRASLRAMSDLSMQLAGAQLGITMASLALGYVAEPAFETIIEAALGNVFGPEVTHGLAIVLALSLAVFLHLVVGEMVPKNIALAAPEATMRWLVLPYRLYLIVFRPFVLALNAVANAGVRLVGVEPRDELMAVHTVSELSALVRQSSREGVIEADDALLLHGALDFAQRPVGEVAPAVGEWATLRLGATAVQAERVVASSGQERIVITRPGHRQELIGYVHARDLFTVSPDQRGAPLPPTLVRNMAIVGSDQSLIDVLRTLRSLGLQMALVKDEGQDPVGIISVEQVTQALIRPADEDRSGNFTRPDAPVRADSAHDM